MERIRNTMDEDREENVCELDDGTGSDDVGLLLKVSRRESGNFRVCVRTDWAHV